LVTQQKQSQQNFKSALSDDIARTFGIEPGQASKAVAEIQDAISYRVQRAMLSRGGVADVVSAMTAGLDAAANGKASLSADSTIAHGNDILAILLGSKHASRGVAGRVARDTGIDVETAKKLLPVVTGDIIDRIGREAAPKFNRMLTDIPALSKLATGPLSLPGEPARTGNGTSTTGDWGASRNANPGTGKSPLPIPGDDIPGVGRSRPSNSPFDQLPDIVRRGGTKSPSGSSLEDIIRQILSNILGVQNRGVIGTIIQLFLVRFVVSIIRRVFGNILPGR